MQPTFRKNIFPWTSCLTTTFVPDHQPVAADRVLPRPRRRRRHDDVRRHLHGPLPSHRGRSGEAQLEIVSYISYRMSSSSIS